MLPLKGIYNGDNSCYLNSSLQCLRNCPYFVSLLRRFHSGKPLATCFLNFIDSGSRRRSTSLDAAQLKKKIFQLCQLHYDETLRPRRHEDAQQFLSYILQLLEVEFTSSDSRLAFRELFHLTLRQDTRCASCNEVSTTHSRSTFFWVKVPNVGSVSLSVLIAQELRERYWLHTLHVNTRVLNFAHYCLSLLFHFGFVEVYGKRFR